MKKSLIAAGAASLALAAMPILGTFADVVDTVTVTISSSCGVASEEDDGDSSTTPEAANSFTATMVNGDTHEWAADGTGDAGDIYVTCNDASGWNITAQGYSGNTAGNTNMVPSSSGTAISTGTTLDGTVSDWAFMIADDDTGATIATNDYTAVPSAATRVAYMSNAPVSEGHIYTGYKVGISPTQAADTYTGKVKYVVSPGAGS